MTTIHVRDDDEPVEQTGHAIDWDIFTDEMLRKITG